MAEAEEQEKTLRLRDYRIYTLNEMYKTTVARSKQVVDWFQNGGVMLMGYEMYRLLVSHKVSVLAWWGFLGSFAVVNANVVLSILPLLSAPAGEIFRLQRRKQGAQKTGEEERQRSSGARLRQH